MTTGCLVQLLVKQTSKRSSNDDDDVASVDIMAQDT